MYRRTTELASWPALFRNGRFVLQCRPFPVTGKLFVPLHVFGDLLDCYCPTFVPIWIVMRAAVLLCVLLLIVPLASAQHGAITSPRNLADLTERADLIV